MILKIFVPDLPATEGQGDGGAGERDELQAAHVQQGGQGDDGDGKINMKFDEKALQRSKKPDEVKQKGIMGLKFMERA